MQSFGPLKQQVSSGDIAGELIANPSKVIGGQTSSQFGTPADPSKYISKSQMAKVVQESENRGVDGTSVILDLDKKGYFLEGAGEAKKQVAKVSWEAQKREAFSKSLAGRYDRTKSGLLAPITRGAGAVVGGTVGFFEGAYEALVPSTVEAFGNIKDIWGDDTLGTDEKFAKTVIGEVVVGWMGGGIGDITGSTLAGAAEGFTTKDEQEKFKTRTAKEVNKVLETETGKKMLASYEQLPQEGKEEVMSLAKDAGNFLDLIDVVALGGAYSVAKKPMSNATKTFLNSMVDSANVARKSQADDLVRVAANESSKGVVGRSKDFVQGYLATKAAGLTPETVSTIKNNPLFTLAQEGKLNRRSLGDEVVAVLGKEQERLSDLGPLYQKIRGSKSTVDFVEVADNVKTNVLDKYNISVDDSGKLDFSLSKFKIDKADQIAIQNGFDVLNDMDVVSADVALNMRHALSSASRFGTDVTGDGAAVVREMRQELSTKMGDSIPGLSAVDAKYGPQRQKINSLMGDYYKKDGEMRENFYSTIANITNKGKELKYDRLNEVMPDLEVKVSALKAWNTVEDAVGAKTGIYDRLGVIGGTTIAGASMGGGILGPVGSMIGGILGFRTGMLMTDVKQIVKWLQKSGAEDLVQKMRSGKMLMDKEEVIVKEAARSVGVGLDDIVETTPPKLNKFDDTIDMSGKPMTRTTSDPMQVRGMPDDVSKAPVSADLMAEARKYDSAEDFYDAYTADSIMDLSDRSKHRFGRLIEDGVNEDTGLYMNAKVTADQYGSRGSGEYQYQRSANVPDVKTKDDMVTIYRGTVKDQKTMEAGDFVSFSKEYAGSHNTDGHIISMRVPAKDVVWQQADLHERIYSPESMRGERYDGGLEKIREQANK